MVSENRSYFSFLLVIALVSLSFTAILIKISTAQISPNATIFHRLWMATLVLGVWELIELIRPKTSKSLQFEKNSLGIKQLNFQQLGLIFLVAFTSTASVVCWAWSLTQTNVANSTILRNFTPLFTSLGSWLFFKVKFERQFIVGMGIALFGIITISWSDFQVGGEHILGDILAISSACLYAVYLLIVERLQTVLETRTILIWRCAIGAVLIAPLVIFSKETIMPSITEGWVILILLAVVCQLIGQGLLIVCLKQFSSGLIAVLLLLQPGLTALLAWGFFEEEVSLFGAIAFLLVIIGIYLAQASERRLEAVSSK